MCYNFNRKKILYLLHIYNHVHVLLCIWPILICGAVGSYCVAPRNQIFFSTFGEGHQLDRKYIQLYKNKYTCKHHTEKALPTQEPRTFLLWANSANHHATVPPYIHVFAILKFKNFKFQNLTTPLVVWSINELPIQRASFKFELARCFVKALCTSPFAKGVL